MTTFRLLLVDDVEDLRFLTKLALRREQDLVVVGEAGDGRQAIELAQSLQPDLVLLDLSMPVMDGLEALPHLRRVAPDAIIFILSGFEASRLEATARGLGAHGYIEKGQHPRELVATIRRALDMLRPRDAGGAS